MVWFQILEYGLTQNLAKLINIHFKKINKLKANPKVHKAGNPYRTIVSGIGTATENMAEIAEKELESFVVSSPSYVKDTTDFLNKVQQIEAVTDQTILFTMNVVKLYPNIPQKEGIQACREGLNL